MPIVVVPSATEVPNTPTIPTTPNASGQHGRSQVPTTVPDPGNFTGTAAINHMINIRSVGANHGISTTRARWILLELSAAPIAPGPVRSVGFTPDHAIP